MKIGLFGGTFNPPHLGHINLALEIQERCELDHIWFIPNNISPFPKEDEIVELSHRLEMVRLAIAPIESFSLCDLEAHRPGPSYTIDTVKQIFEMEPDSEFSLLVSGYSEEEFMQWKGAEELLTLLPILAGVRSQQKGKIPGARLVAMPLFDISATQVRARLKKRLYCGHLLSGEVLDYIYENQLYYTS